MFTKTELFSIQLEKTITILKDELNRLHQELLQVRTDLKLEKTKNMDLSLALSNAERDIFLLQEQYDNEIREISSKLLSLESSFLKEQKQIQDILESKDQMIDELQEQLKTRDNTLEQRNRELNEVKHQFEKELKARDKRIASQWRELESLKNSNTKFMGALSQLRSTSLMTRSASSISTCQGNPGTQRRALSPNTARRKFRESSEWKEELSAFF